MNIGVVLLVGTTGRQIQLAQPKHVPNTGCTQDAGRTLCMLDGHVGQMLWTH